MPTYLFFYTGNNYVWPLNHTDVKNRRTDGRVRTAPQEFCTFRLKTLNQIIKVCSLKRL